MRVALFGARIPCGVFLQMGIGGVPYRFVPGKGGVFLPVRAVGMGFFVASQIAVPVAVAAEVDDPGGIVGAVQYQIVGKVIS